MYDDEENRPVRLVRAFDGSQVPSKLNRMNCGGVPIFDHESGCSYRCDACFAVIGSSGQSQRCKDLNK